MRDKLVKYHHKAIYYRLRKVALVLFFVVLTSAVIAIPISILSVTAEENESSEILSSSEETSIPEETEEAVHLSL